MEWSEAALIVWMYCTCYALVHPILMLFHLFQLWDIRMVSERLEISTGTSTERHPVNEVNFDRSGGLIACASDKGTVNV